MGLIVLLIVVAAAYFLYSDTMMLGTPGGTAVQEMEKVGIPGATDSIADFETAMQAELAASAAAIKALDSDVDASVSEVVNSGNNVYDPNNI